MTQYTYRLDRSDDSRPHYRPQTFYQSLPGAMQALTDLPAYDNASLTNIVTGDILIHYRRATQEAPQ